MWESSRFRETQTLRYMKDRLRGVLGGLDGGLHGGSYSAFLLYHPPACLSSLPVLLFLPQAPAHPFPPWFSGFPITSFGLN